MDSPKGYCCRITRSKLFSIPPSALQVKSKLLPLLSVVIASKVSIHYENFDSVIYVVNL
jgi:hypothetical protein